MKTDDKFLFGTVLKLSARATMDKYDLRSDEGETCLSQTFDALWRIAKEKRFEIFGS